MTAEHFSSDTFAFLTDLKANNDREWFAANKARYEASVREPALALVRALGLMLPSISPHFVADDRKQGGSLMKIHRDVRFSNDKSPYKTNIGIQLRHESGKDAHAPGFYFHVEPGSVFVGVGIWAPPNDVLARIRGRLDARPDDWRQARQAATDAGFALAGDSLQRVPRGFDKDHPLAEDLKRKSCIVSIDLEPTFVTTEGLPERLIERFAAASPIARFVCEALEVSY